MFNEFFKKSGFTCNAYSNSLLALEEFRKNQDNYDLVISDIRMPEMNGIELTTTIRKMNKDIPIILMSAYDVIDIQPSLLEFLNIEGIITKPIKLKDLIEKINTIKQKIILKE